MFRFLHPPPFVTTTKRRIPNIRKNDNIHNNTTIRMYSNRHPIRPSNLNTVGSHRGIQLGTQLCLKCFLDTDSSNGARGAIPRISSFSTSHDFHRGFLDQSFTNLAFQNSNSYKTSTNVNHGQFNYFTNTYRTTYDDIHLLTAVRNLPVIVECTLEFRTTHHHHDFRRPVQRTFPHHQLQ